MGFLPINPAWHPSTQIFCHTRTACQLKTAALGRPNLAGRETSGPVFHGLGRGLKPAGWRLRSYRGRLRLTPGAPVGPFAGERRSAQTNLSENREANAKEKVADLPLPATALSQPACPGIRRGGGGGEEESRPPQPSSQSTTPPPPDY